MAPAPELKELIRTVEVDAAAPEPLRQLAMASQTAAELTETSDALVGHFVDRCRKAGHSWAEISGALGVTKQAAHKRFSWATPALERFTARAREAVDAATDAAKALDQPYVGTEHVLLGLFEPEGSIALAILEEAGLTRDGVEAALLARIPRGAGAPGEPPLTPRAASALAGALSEALALGHNYIGTEHILLGLFREPEGVAYLLLEEAGVTHDACRAKVLEMLSGYAKGT